MKTAANIAYSDKYFSDMVLDIQEYGRQCAEQALKDAAESLEKDFFLSESVYNKSKKSILATKIQTK